jgi:aminodeoxyfutalosine deaminase
MTDSWTLTAHWIFPIDQPPLEHGTVTINGDRIEAVNVHGERTADVDLGNVAVLPGFVNAHTHLDLTGLRGQAPPSPDFTGWLRQVIAHRRNRTPEQVREDIQTGLAECLRFGTTLLGDISGDGGSWDVLTDAPVRAVVFLELLGLTTERARNAIFKKLRWTQSIRSSPTCKAGVSPHAPYSVHAAIFRWVGWHGWLTATHLAESAAEIELLENQRGPFVQFLEELGVWGESGSLAKSLDWILWRTQRVSSILFVHANFLRPDAPIRPNGTVVYCPRTHAAFGHPPHPFREFLKRGVRVALGTDSLASNPDLDILGEMRFLHSRYPGVPGDVVLRMGTLAGAETLGWSDETGSLTPGKSADLVVLPLPPDEAADPYWLVLESTLQVGRVLFRGQWRGE